jgi:hypothetical protein
MALHQTVGRRRPPAGERQRASLNGKAFDNHPAVVACNLSAGGTSGSVSWPRFQFAARFSCGSCEFPARFSSGQWRRWHWRNLPLAKIVAALVGPSALGWLISPAAKMVREVRLFGGGGVQPCEVVRTRPSAWPRRTRWCARSSCFRRAAKASQGGLMLSNMPMKRTKACQLFCDDCLAGAARPLR